MDEPGQTAGPTAGVADSSSAIDTRVVYCGDNLDLLRELPDACIDLAYIDPPFRTNRGNGMLWDEARATPTSASSSSPTQAYIEHMRLRCAQIARVLKPTGTFYYHCDWHASHLVRVMLDEVFGEDNCLNEIVWVRGKAGSNVGRGGRYLRTVHDSILCYVREVDGPFTFRTQYEPLPHSAAEKRYRHVEEGTGRRYSTADLTDPQGETTEVPTYEWRGMVRPWRYSRAGMERLEQEGRLTYTKTGMVYQKRYLDESNGPPLSDCWDDVEVSGGAAAAGERLGYPTQKPLGLLNRIIELSSRPDDVVLDAFCGSGSTLVAAQNLGRRWVGVDVSPTACRVTAKRLRDTCKLAEGGPDRGAGSNDAFAVRSLPWTVERLRALSSFEFEAWAAIAVADLIDATSTDGSATVSANGRPFPVVAEQSDAVGRPAVRTLGATLEGVGGDGGQLGLYVAFGYASEAEQECADFHRRTGRTIRLVTVRDLLGRRQDRRA